MARHPGATPGLTNGGREFCSNDAPFVVRDVLARFDGGPAVVGVCGRAFKGPPAPSETEFLMHDLLAARSRRAASKTGRIQPIPLNLAPRVHAMAEDEWRTPAGPRAWQLALAVQHEQAAQAFARLHVEVRVRRHLDRLPARGWLGR
jgi:hypothetical protein